MHPKLGLIGGIRVVARFGLVCDGGWDLTEGQGGLRMNRLKRLSRGMMCSERVSGTPTCFN